MSRYPALGRGGYDESLLQIAPQITKADRQQGYSVDMLEQGGQSNFYGTQFGPNVPRPRSPSAEQFAQGYEQPRSQQRQPPQQPVSSYPYDRSSPPSLEKADYYSSTSLDQRDVYTVNPYRSPKRPWFRTKRGIAIMFLIIILLTGGVVGIALGIIMAKNKADADKKGVQQGAQEGGGSTGGGGVAPSSAEAGSGAANTNNPNALPSLPTLSIISLNLGQQPAATATAPAGLVPTTNPALATSAIVQTRPVATTPARTTRTILVTAAPTTSVDPICVRFPSLPSCQRR